MDLAHRFAALSSACLLDWTLTDGGVQPWGFPATFPEDSPDEETQQALSTASQQRLVVFSRENTLGRPQVRDDSLAQGPGHPPGVPEP